MVTLADTHGVKTGVLYFLKQGIGARGTRGSINPTLVTSRNSTYKGSCLYV